MRIAYVCNVAAFAVDGVNDKIGTQVGHWRAAGHDVTLLCLSPAPEPGRDRAMLPADRIFTYRGLAGRVRATLRLIAAVRRSRPDVVYLRYDVFLPPLPPALWPLPVVVEVNTGDRHEAVLEGGHARLYNALTRGATLRRVAGIVTVTNALARSEDLARYRKPTVVIANGADPTLSTPLPPATGTRPAAVMLVGYASAWAGVDKVLDLARGLTELDVHMLGCAPSGPLPANVRTYGTLPRAGYRDILAKADFGIGPMALHRKEMSEASPLKVREYLLHGLPVLIAHEDTDFPGQEPWYLMRLPNREDNITASLPAIREWAATVSGRRVPSESVVDRLGVERKEQARLAFLGGLARDGRPANGAARP